MEPHCILCLWKEIGEETSVSNHLCHVFYSTNRARNKVYFRAKKRYQGSLALWLVRRSSIWSRFKSNISLETCGNSTILKLASRLAIWLLRIGYKTQKRFWPRLSKKKNDQLLLLLHLGCPREKSGCFQSKIKSGPTVQFLRSKAPSRCRNKAPFGDKKRLQKAKMSELDPFYQFWRWGGGYSRFSDFSDTLKFQIALVHNS